MPTRRSGATSLASRQRNRFTRSHPRIPRKVTDFQSSAGSEAGDLHVTPHRGSDLASNWIGRLAATFVKIPFLVATVPVAVISAAAEDPEMFKAKRLPTASTRFLPIIGSCSR